MWGKELISEEVYSDIENRETSFAVCSSFSSFKTELIKEAKSQKFLHYVNLDILFVNNLGRNIYISTFGNSDSNKSDIEMLDTAIAELKNNNKILIIDRFQYASSLFTSSDEYIAKFRDIVDNKDIQIIFISNNIGVPKSFLDDKDIIIIDKPTYAVSKEYIYNEFAKASLSISDENIDDIINRTQRVPYYMYEAVRILNQNKQLEGNSLDLENEEIRDSDINSALASIYDNEEKMINFMLQKISTRKYAIDILSKVAINKTPYEVLDDYSIQKPYVNTVLKYLTNNEILYVDAKAGKFEDKYNFVNPIMKEKLSERVKQENLNQGMQKI